MEHLTRCPQCAKFVELDRLRKNFQDLLVCSRCREKELIDDFVYTHGVERLPAGVAVADTVSLPYYPFPYRKP